MNLPIKAQTAVGLLKRIYLPLVVGLGLSQVVASVAVYCSNHQIYATARAIESSGYLFIPTGPALETLPRISSVLGGGLFFTLSIGTGLTLAAWAAAFIWCRVARHRRELLVFYGILYGLLFIGINRAGFVWLPSTLCLLVPSSTAWITVRVMASHDRSANWSWLVPLFTLVVLTVLWATQLNQHLFIAIRDHILLSNPMGQRVNDFYYRYTLYAAEVFKSFHQKTVRTYGWVDPTGSDIEQRIADRLIRNDVLPLTQSSTPDVILSLHPDTLELRTISGRGIQVPPEEFLAATPKWLLEYSQQTDRLSPFRRITFFGLLIGFPVLLFVTIYGVLRIIASLILEERRAVWWASGACLVLGVLLFLPMLLTRSSAMANEKMAKALSAEAWPRRVAALRRIEQEEIDISRFPNYRALVKSPLVVERYWLARAMAASRTQSTYIQLKALAKDPHPNVVCQAYYALGRRGNPGAINFILRHLKTSDHWYTQWYGYRAVRRLGWQQKPSKR